MLKILQRPWGKGHVLARTHQPSRHCDSSSEPLTDSLVRCSLDTIGSPTLGGSSLSSRNALPYPSGFYSSPITPSPSSEALVGLLTLYPPPCIPLSPPLPTTSHRSTYLSSARRLALLGQISLLFNAFLLAPRTVLGWRYSVNTLGEQQLMIAVCPSGAGHFAYKAYLYLRIF